MKKIAVMMMALLCLFSCDNEDFSGSKRKERMDIPLTKAEEQIVAYTNEFAFNLFRKINEKTQDENLFISPLSATVAFSMLNNGAAGITRQEIQETLGYKDFSMDEINGFYRKMLDAAVDVDPQVLVSSANSIWIGEKFPVLAPFVKTNKTCYDAEVYNVNFGQSQTLSRINQWVSGNTRGMIPQILKQLDPNTVMLLINALYFKGEWYEPFNKNTTKDEVFTNKDGSRTMVPMMYRSMQNLYAANETYAMTSLAYGNGAFQMVFVLPHEGIELSTVIAGLTDESWQECMYKNRVGCTVKLKLPRFKTDYTTDLNDVLKELGMPSVFNSATADFSSISNSPTYVTLAKQKAQIIVDEKGTEAAAATEIEGVVSSPGPRPGDTVEFYLDRPFLYFIREVSTGTIFFMGTIEQL